MSFSAALIVGIFFGFILEFFDQAEQVFFDITFGHLHELIGSISFGQFGNFFQFERIMSRKNFIERINTGVCGITIFKCASDFFGNFDKDFI